MINTVYANLQGIEYIEDAKQTDTLVIPKEANGAYTDMRDMISTLRQMGIRWDFVEDAGIYMWKCYYKYYYAEEESHDTFMANQCEKYIGEIRIYYKSKNVMGYEVKYYQRIS